jgi:hydrogenase expression/formation protein HypC
LTISAAAGIEGRVCLAVPGRVVDIRTEDGVRMGRVDFDGVQKSVCLEHTPEVKPGQYVIVHVGFALQVVDEAEAREIFAFLRRMPETLEPGDAAE